MRLAVEQVIEIHANGHHFRDVIVLTDKHEGGAPARHGETVHKELNLNLGNIKFVPPHERKKKGVVKAVSAEDQYMMSSIPPACHAGSIKNDYYLTVRCTYEGCTCCAETPYAKVPLTILPYANPTFFM